MLRFFGGSATPGISQSTLDAAVSLLQDKATATTDAELYSAVSTLTTALGAKQDSSTAATDSELASAVALLQDKATAATDSELASAVSTINSALSLKQDASTAATDSELSSAMLTVPKIWAASTAYTAGQWVVTPGGYLASAKTGFTSGATYSPSNWNEFIPGAELAYAENISGTNVTAPVNSTVDVTGLTIAVPACPRPVYLTTSLLVAISTASALMTYSIVEVSNGVDTAVTRNRVISGHASAGGFIHMEFTTRIAANTLRTRNFKVQAQSNSGTGVVTVNVPSRTTTSLWDCYVKAICS